VTLASRGRRQTERGEEAIADPWLVGQLRRQARELLVEAVLIAAFLTGVALMLPW
jgi:hypothetical protein